MILEFLNKLKSIFWFNKTIEMKINVPSIRRLRCLGNYPFNEKDKCTIYLREDDSEWQEAYTNWLAMKTPTDSKEWKKGIHLTYEEVLIYETK